MLFGAHAEPIEIHGPGEDLLLLPAFEGPLEMEIHLHTGGGTARSATSLGLGSEQHTTARIVDLRRSYFMSGDVGSAAFHATDGDDFAAWSGFSSFDPRFVAAETAGTRTAIDQAMNRAPDSGAMPFSLLFVASRRSDPAILVVRKPHGVVVSVDPGAPWAPSASIRVAQVLAQRYVGGLVWVGDRTSEASGYFFSEGFSRALAREVLFEVGVLAHPDRASEINGLLATLALSPLGRVSMADLARDATPDSVSVATARGALVATALDSAMRKKSNGRGSLARFIRALVERSIEEKSDAISFTAFMTAMHDATGDKAFASLESTLVRGADPMLPSDLLGPCYRLAKKDISAFDLGFVLRRSEPLAIESVTPGSRAEAAGLHAGDAIRDLHYRDGISDSAVTLTVVRGTQSKPLRFMPAGRAVKGSVFERIRSVSEERCGG